MKNVNAGKTAKTEKTESKKNFDTVKRDFEKAYAKQSNYTQPLDTLAQTITFSILNKMADPQCRNAAKHEKVSDNACNPYVAQLRRDVIDGTKTLENTRKASNAASKLAYTVDGDLISDIVDADAAAAVTANLAKIIPDGYDVKQECMTIIQEYAIKYAGGGVGWLDRPHKKSVLDKRVIIRAGDSASYHDIDIAPIVEIYRDTAAYARKNRQPSTDPKSKELYISDIAVNPDGETLDTIYYKLDKCADIGGYPVAMSNSTIPGAPAGYPSSLNVCTVDNTTAKDYMQKVKKLNLTARQAAILKLRMRADHPGYKAIGTYLGITPSTVKDTLHRIQQKAIDAGITFTD